MVEEKDFGRKSVYRTSRAIDRHKKIIKEFKKEVNQHG
jgi:hypothetical protein